MSQDYAASPHDHLASLRNALATQHIDCFVVPRVDRYQGEYVTPADDRLAWLTGFNGSAGLALILKDKAALFVDGRYTVQAKQQVPMDLYEVFQTPQGNPAAYLQDHLKFHPKKDSFVIAYDPWLFTLNDRDRWQKICDSSPCQLKPLEGNPLDGLWTDRPARPMYPVFVHEVSYAGKSARDKIAKIHGEMDRANADALLVTSPISLCWLLNIRGIDFPCTPLVDALAIVHRHNPLELFVNPDKVPQEVMDHFNGIAVVRSETDLPTSLKELSSKTVWVNPAQAPVWMVDRLKDSTLFRAPDPCLLAKAIKNETELKGFHAAHLRDGVALTKFLAWLDQYYQHSQDEELGALDEISVAEKLEGFRREGDLYQGPSFATISGFGSNGAIVHYHATQESCKKIDRSSLLLVDSGGQYLDGTTDVTRTICVGEPSQDQKRHYTLVLKGHINLAKARFPEGTSGSQLDAIARFPLWQEGLDYDHGTGHGVGHFLSVHEGPQSISKSPNAVPLQSGMVVSNEPGYYKEGHYGIRIENLVEVVKVKGDFERKLLAFETLTLAPLDRKLIDEDMLVKEEWTWLNTYHQQVRESLLPYLDPDTAAWLIDATQEI